jgi:hypothetical protein
MKKSSIKGCSLFSILLLFVITACVDRINFNIGNATSTIVIDGYISDQPGPYTIKLSKAFDIESKSTPKIDVSAKQVTISDNFGNQEILSGTDGFYQTDPNGMRGMIGRTYTLRVELLDGRIFESTDSLLAGGSLDSIYYFFKENKNIDGSSTYGFDVLFNSAAGTNGSDHFIWKLKGTYQVETSPQLHREPCIFVIGCPSPLPCGCPLPLPCSGYVLKLGTIDQIEYVKPCECCTCWVDIYNEGILISDDQFSKSGKFNNIKAAQIPITQYTFMYKMRVEVSQLSLTPRTFRFWKAIKDQQDAVGSLFQPITGKIPSAFVQLSGDIGPPAQGVFFATSIQSRHVYIDRADIPNPLIIPQGVDYPFPFKKEDGSCLDFPFSTNVKPSFWED